MGFHLTLSLEDVEGKTVIRLVGRLDAASSALLEKKAAELLASHQAKVVVDFSGVEYLSSAGLRLLLSLTKKWRAADGKLVFCCMNGEVLAVIKMAGFERILTIYPREKEALAALQ